MPPGTQSKILRVLVDQAFQRVGGANTVRVDVRVISATTRDLAREVQAGRFRTELFHRLNVVPVSVPGLEARREDIPELARHFLEELNGGPGPAAARAGARGGGAAADHALAGQRAAAAQHAGAGADPRAGPRPDRAGGAGARGAAERRRRPSGTLGAAFAGLALREAREMFEREYLVAQINRFGGNISRTANFVGMERSALASQAEVAERDLRRPQRARRGGRGARLTGPPAATLPLPPAGAGLAADPPAGGSAASACPRVAASRPRRGAPPARVKPSRPPEGAAGGDRGERGGRRASPEAAARP